MERWVLSRRSLEQSPEFFAAVEGLEIAADFHEERLLGMGRDAATVVLGDGALAMEVTGRPGSRGKASHERVRDRRRVVGGTHDAPLPETKIELLLGKAGTPRLVRSLHRDSIPRMNHYGALVAGCVLPLFATLAIGCSCNDGGNSGTDGAVTGDGAGHGDGSARDARASGADGSGSSQETCDGVDNDHNGIIDDVDVGADGICDCLLIATLGLAGEWGAGDVFAAWLDARSDAGATDLGDAVLTNELLRPYQVIVAQDMRGRDYAEAEVAALRGWIEEGGGLMTLIGYGSPAERTNVNQLLVPSGIQYDGTAILPGSPTIPITTWHPHPVSQMVTAVGVDNGYEVVGSGTVIAEQGGLVLLRATTLGLGRVLVWGDEWITYDSEWVDHPEYQLERFWLNAIKWLTPEAECQVPILI